MLFVRCIPDNAISPPILLSRWRSVRLSLQKQKHRSPVCLNASWQIMLMITKGQKVNEISEQLNLSPKTVNSYRYRMFSKLNIHGDVELTHLAIRHGLCNAETLTSQ
ncbi:response regulator [Salmonella enterica subsp. arizonae]|uniref:Response regulator n=1 Tax=Salmonella enterica subsp. arizonae TaxID=59203 RepID=A0A379STA7_SALER|nr:response regulator [Salmonella enterica subsp. arizonae]